MILNYKLLSICIFQNVTKDKAIANLVSCFAYMESSLSEAVIRYVKFLKIIYESEFSGDFSKYLEDLILHDENLFTQAVAKGKELPQNIQAAAEHEIEIFSDLMKITSNSIKQALLNKFEGSNFVTDNLGDFSNSKTEITFDEVKNYCKAHGFGIFAKYGAFCYDKECRLKPVYKVDKITLDDLKDYEVQKKKLLDNTAAFVSGLGANNVLLYGDRGCGKSSSVKAVFNKFSTQGLKIVQILKNDLCVLSNLLCDLAKIPAKFIVFIDDLSFSQEDENLSAVKSALEGALSAQAENIVIYATTNRRNIVKETFSGREGNEVHLSDTIDENASLSDRFGIKLTYLAPNKEKFFEIARKIAADEGVQLGEDFEFEANKFAMQKASYSPRVAKQFVKNYFCRC